MISQYSARLSLAVLLGFGAVCAEAGVTTRVSVDHFGREGSDESSDPVISADGRYVAFQSSASSLVPGDTNGMFDIYLKDRATGRISRMSVDGAGVQGNGNSMSPAISANGRYVAFTSEASNLVANDTNERNDVFVHDRVTGVTTRVSVADGAIQAENGDALSPWISADGRYIAYTSDATNIVPGCFVGFLAAYVFDRVAGVTSCVSVNNAGEPADWLSGAPRLSADGRYVAFISGANNLVAGGTNGREQVYVHDRNAHTTTLVSVNDAGEMANDGFAGLPELSGDGRYVAFYSEANNLVANDFNQVGDAFVHDRVNRTTTRVSVDGAGVEGNGPSIWGRLSISNDGRYVAFFSGATNLTAQVSTGSWNVYVRDLVDKTTAMVSVSTLGAVSDVGGSLGINMSANGRFVAFDAPSTNLVPADTNETYDVFVHDRLAAIPLEGPYGAATCTDGTDNDGDGHVDAADAECAAPPAPLRCAGKRVTIVGTASDDHYVGTSNDDVIAGFGGDDVLDGAGGNDVICGGAGNDTLVGGEGRDTLIGGSGEDTLVGGLNVDKLNGGSDADSCDGGEGTDMHLGGCEVQIDVP